MRGSEYLILLAACVTELYAACSPPTQCLIKSYSDFSADPCTRAQQLATCFESSSVCAQSMIDFCAIQRRSTNCLPTQCDQTQFNQYHIQFEAAVDAKRIKQASEAMSSRPHIAGSANDKTTAEYVNKKFQEAGIDSKIETFPVLLSYPGDRKVSIEAPASAKKDLDLDETPMPQRTGQQYWEEAVKTFNAYSATGTATAKVVFINYCMEEDFNTAKKANIVIKGTIVLCKYGKIYRGNKAALVAANGGVAMLVYLDPKDYGFMRGKAYPDGPFASNTTVQRGSMWLGDGDPLTPGWHATEDGAVLTMEQVNSGKFNDPLPTIPIQPLPWGSAYAITQQLTAGQQLPDGWESGLNITNVGPGPVVVNMNIVNNKNRTDIWNVYGRIQGAIEPDRTVIIGSHRDAWTYGTVDPIGSMAPLVEIATIFGQLLKSGWKPRRTIILASWDAEEYALIGSTEYVEKNFAYLKSNAVLYFNTDGNIAGKTKFITSALPGFKEVLVRHLRVPLNSTHTLKDVYVGNRLVGSGSDSHSFLVGATVPVIGGVDLDDDPSTYAVYHSNHDDMYWMQQFTDPDWKHHAVLTKYIGRVFLEFADNAVLPFNMVDYATTLEENVVKLKQEKAELDITSIAAAVARLKTAATALSVQQEAMRKKTITPADFAELRRLNDKLMNFERVFFGDTDITGHVLYHHVLWAPGRYNSYAGIAFPVVGDALHVGDVDRANWLVKRLALYIEQAADFLSDDHW